MGRYPVLPNADAAGESLKKEPIKSSRAFSIASGRYKVTVFIQYLLGTVTGFGPNSPGNAGILLGSDRIVAGKYRPAGNCCCRFPGLNPADLWVSPAPPDFSFIYIQANIVPIFAKRLNFLKEIIVYYNSL
jgi:hypothetical protein